MGPMSDSGARTQADAEAAGDAVQQIDDSHKNVIGDEKRKAMTEHGYDDVTGQWPPVHGVRPASGIGPDFCSSPPLDLKE